MSTRKPPVLTVPPEAPLFPLGDPEGAVRWTPAMRKKVFPRRELAPKAPKIGDPSAFLGVLRANAEAVAPRFDRGATVAGADHDLHAGLRAAKAWIDGDPLHADLPEELAPLVFQLAEIGDTFRAEPLTAGLVDLWVARHGLAYALRSLAAAFDVAYASNNEHGASIDVPTPKPRRGFGLGPTISMVCPAFTLLRGGHARLASLYPEGIPSAIAGTRELSLYLYAEEFIAWLRLREHLASAPADRWGSVVEGVAAPLAEGASVLVRHLVAWSFPERPGWAEALIADPASKKHALYPMLTACLRDPSKLATVQCHYFHGYFQEACASMLAAAGPNAAAGLLEVGERTRPAAESRYALSLVAQIDSDAAVGGLIARVSNPRFAEAITLAEANFPERAKRMAKAKK